ncbi:MAG: DUF3240 family protein [Xanthomonadaceae bacterium]|jgi:hypothetical protein|nr:DUF3240 family protein [Xanthomonadaceae bacterium]
MVQVNVTFPPALEKTVTEAMMAALHAPRFTIIKGYGHGFAHKTRIEERIHGKSDRYLAWALAEEKNAGPLLDFLRRHVKSHDALWWITPIIDAGALA